MPSPRSVALVGGNALENFIAFDTFVQHDIKKAANSDSTHRLPLPVGLLRSRLRCVEQQSSQGNASSIQRPLHFRP
jgi:hypothetical protein